jgi:hypothetical protein
VPRELKSLSLSKARRDAAVRIAKGDPRLQQLLAGSAQPIIVEPNLHDPTRPDGDLVVIGVRDDAAEHSLVALVDPAAKRVVGVERIHAQFQLSNDERSSAGKLAAADTRVRAFLAGRPANPLPRLYFPPAGVRVAGHRYAIVFVRPTTSERRYAVVDLTVGKVVDVLDSLTG